MADMTTATTHRTATPIPGFDVERIRADFPILFREIYGRPLVYLDSAASAQKPRSVIEAMDHFQRFDYANVHRGIHYLSNTSTQKYEEAREIGWTDEQLLEAIAFVALEGFTAMVNVAGDVPVDGSTEANRLLAA